MRKTYYLLIALLCMMVSGAAAQTTAYFLKSSSASLFSMDVTTPGTSEQEVVSMGSMSKGDMLVTGETANGKYYVIKWNEEVYLNQLCAVDLSAFSYKVLSGDTDVIELTDMTYDAANGVMYGVKGKTLYKLDLTDGSSTKVMDYAGTLRGIACNGNGQLYTINKNAAGKFTLDTINLTDFNYAEGPELTSDMLKNINTRQSLSFDENGKLYWLADVQTFESGYSYVFYTAEINPENGAVTLLADLSEKYAGLAMGEISGGSEPDPEPEVVSRVKYEYLIGDAMGDNEDVTKYTEYFYGSANELLRALEYSRDSETGEFSPYTYSKWVTTVDAEGNKTVTQSKRKKVAGAGSLSDIDRYWQKYDEIDVTVYAADGKELAYTKTGNTRTENTYKGDNLISQVEIYITGGSMDGKIKSKVFYSDFVPGLVNCPQTVLVGAIPVETSPANVIIMEYKYDKAGHKTECITYKTTGSVADEDGVYWEGAEKAEPKQKEIWNYDVNGRLTQYIKYVSYKNGDWVASFNNKKTEYIYNNNVTENHSYSGDGMTLDGWYKSGTYTKEENSDFYGPSALTGFAVSAKEGKPGVYVLTADAPLMATSYIYNVYRDGEIVGEMKADAEAGNYSYEDVVGVGLHDWFVQTFDAATESALNITQAIEMDVKLVLNPVTEIEVLFNETRADSCTVDLKWKEPATEGAKLLGYNFYANVVNIDQATPVNRKLITEPAYSFSWVIVNIKDEEDKLKEFWIEAVYDLGKVKSEKQTVVLNIPTSIGQVTEESKLVIDENSIRFDGDCTALTVRNVNGVCVAKQEKNEISIAHLDTGIYLVTVDTGDALFTVKFIK